MAAHYRADTVDKIQLSQLLERQVDRNATRRTHATLPYAKILANLVEHPFANLDDQAGFFRDGYKVGGQDEAAFRQLPADQRLCTKNLSGF